MRNLRQMLQEIWHTCSGEAAWQAVADLSRCHRIQASPGYRQAADLIYQRLVEAGLDAQILSYPADERASFWTWSSFQEWECTDATLHLSAPPKEAQVLADYRAAPISVIQRSVPFEGEVEVVALEDGLTEADYEGLDIAGKVVLTRGDLRRVWQLAVKERGAAGILFDGMRTVPPVRPAGDLADVRQYTSFWWRPGDKKCFGFVLTPRQGQELRQLLKSADEPVLVAARVVSRLYDGAMEVVSATIPGETVDEILVVAHLCHPLPSANDNASGAAAVLEAARTLQTLIARGGWPMPRRTIRFLWLPEMTGSFAYLSEHEAELGQMIAGINLDMVGEDQDQTGSSWLIERPPDSAASFAPTLLSRLRDELPALKNMADVFPSHTCTGAYPLYRQAEVPFVGGSDHYIFSDPTVGVPMPALNQWPDRFYHTEADTPERTDPHSLARAGTLAAAYAWWLATADAQGSVWLGYEMMARFKGWLVEAAQATVTEALTLDDAAALAGAVIRLDRRFAYLLDRQKAALRTLVRLGPVDCLAIDLLAHADGAAREELAWARGFVELHAAALGLEALPIIPPRDLSEQEEQASDLIPVRQVRGPVPLEEYLGRLTEQDRNAWRQLLEERQDWSHDTLCILALYWADGTRTVLEIADLVELETGIRDVELLLAYFRLLGKLEFVSFH